MTALLAQSTLTQVLTFTVRPAATYRALELGVPTPWLGALGASFAVVPLLLALPSGHAADRFGERAVMMAGSLLMAASGVTFLAFSRDVAGLVLGSVVLGTGHLLTVIGQQAAVANTAAEGTFDAAFGHYTFAASLGQALGPALLAVAGGRSTIPDTAAVFTVAVAVGVLLVLCTLAIKPTRPSRDRPDADRGGIAVLLKAPGLTRALLISCIVLAAVDISLVYLPALGADRGMSAGFVGVLLVLRAAASMASRLFLGQLVSWLGRTRLMLVSIALAAASMTTVALPMPTVFIVMLVVLLGLGLGVGQPLTMSWLAEAAPPGLRGRAMSLRLTGNRLGQVVIPSAVGAVAVGVGAAGVFWATAAALGCAGLAARKLVTVSPTPTSTTPTSTEGKS
ncbi:MFS transporter [Nakamurella deserti]|uniref:MFS transporter n=1 Tax=Nakamurella deserti TaxID=2164074 RepID=UPI00197BBCDA|nr:MFS transporter [Nakamurella deserti]